MSDLQSQLDRLSSALGLTRGVENLQPRPAPQTKSPHGIETLVAGRVVETPHGECFLREEIFPTNLQHSRYQLSDCLQANTTTIAAIYPEAGLEQFDFSRAAFLDTETNGLANGAGSYAFLIGLGIFEKRESEECFVVRQFFMRNEREERAMLHALNEILVECGSLVTFNGRAFDAPLLASRYVMQRTPSHALNSPHLDLLLPARRVWRRRLASCALGNLETEILGLQRQQTDVPGWLIPSLYFQYLQTGDARDLAGVFYHNLEDILSMVTLATILAKLFTDPWAEETVHALDMTSLGWSYDQAGLHVEAERAYRHALSHALPNEVRMQTYSKLGALLKRQAQMEKAVEIWQAWLTDVNGQTVEPFVELAKWCEWRTNDLEAALMWTRWAEHEAGAWPHTPARRVALADLKTRATRLERKIARGTAPQTTPQDAEHAEQNEQ